MIKNKHISKITMLTCLMLAGVVNAQEFYTCVPKKSWWKDVMTESVKTGVKKEREENLKVIKLTPKSAQSEFKQILQPGRYKVIAAAAGGSPETREFVLEKPAEFKACAGDIGEDSVNGGNSGKGGNGRGGNGRGYNGDYLGGINGGYNGASSKGYGTGDGGVGGIYKGANGGTGGTGGLGCFGGAEGGKGYGGGAGGGEGSYFMVADIELILRGGKGGNGSGGVGGKALKNPGYVYIDKIF